MRIALISLTLALFSLSGATSPVGAQPRIAYIIPDIGAENMNTAVEIVAPHDANGTFGDDGFYFNNPGDDVRVDCTDPDVVVGPLVVSWDGRLISTQVFVRPNAQTKTVELRVTAQSATAKVNFDIVTPVNSINVPPSGALGSGGLYGTRSKRGAMIVETLNLGTAAYTVSTGDPDGINGNQGYLPMIIIARNVVNLGTSTINAGGNGKNGGPGGGGGGGQNCDSRPFGGGGREGSTGGDGFTGGGGGGRNGAGSSAGQADNRVKAAGIGTGTAGQSLSGVAAALGSAECNNPEGAGGGTGHPFGKGGENACVGFRGFYGGGGSAGSDGGGGGAGYAVDGQNAMGPSAGSTRGERHGNTHVVPLAGGSGGSSGNPGGFSSSGNCSGEGGGGGGAIAIYSMNFFTSQASILAQGAGGTQGDGNADGGGGSGGAIVIGAKGMTNQIRSIGQHNVAGGSGPGGGGDGAAGRFRYDGFHLNPPTTGTTGASTYTGPSTDTLTYVEGYDFTLRGTRGANQPIRVYMRSATGTWNQEGTPTYNGREWTLDITAADTGYHYIVALQQGSNVSGTYTDEPAWVNSQVAANVVRIASVPRIDTVGFPLNFGPVGKCPGVTVQVSIIRFRSTGTEDLNVRTEIRNESAPGTFTVYNPPGVTAPGGADFPPDPSTVQFIGVRATPMVSGVHTAELLVITNDPRSGFDTLRAPLSIQIFDNSITFDNDTIDFGDLCITQQKDSLVGLTYAGESPQFNADIDAVNNPAAPFHRVTPTSTTFQFRNPLLDPNYDSTVNLSLRFRPTMVGSFLDSVTVVDECGRPSILYVKGKGVEAELLLSVSGVPSDLVDFGPVRVGNTQQGSIWIRNTGDSPVTLGNGVLVPPPGGPFRVVSPIPINGTSIDSGDSIEVVFEFTPDTVTTLTPYTGTYNVMVQGPCADVPTIRLLGEGVEICFSSSLDSITLVADSCASDPDTLRIVSLLKNCGGEPVDIENIFSVNGKLIDSGFDGKYPFRLGIGDENDLVLRWDPADGTGTDSIGIAWRDVNGEIVDTLYISASLQFDKATVELQTVDGDPLPDQIDIGGVYQCGPAEGRIVVKNTGTIEGRITGRWAAGGIFDVVPGLQSAYIVDVNDTIQLVLRLDPARAPVVGQVYEDTLILVNGRCPIEWKIAVRATRYELEVTAGDLDFGATNLNRARSGSVTFRNLTNALPSEELTIERVYIDPPGANPPFAIESAPGLPIQVQAAGGTYKVDLSFTPDAEQIYTGRLCFEISYPCDTTICVDLKGEGIRSNIYVPKRDLSFGETYFCNEDTLGLSIFSVGPDPLRIDSIRIVGPDAPGFEIINISQALPKLLLPGFPTIVDSINVLVRFIPANVPPDGVKDATLEIYSNDSAQGLVSIPLTGERTSPSIVGPGLVDYGTVVVNGSSMQRLTLTNTSDDEITINSPLLNPPFRIVTSVPLVIPARGSLEIDVEFAPDDSEVYHDTLIGSFNFPCAGEFRVPLTGEGLRGETVISIPGDLSGEPGERILVPIVLEEATALADVGANTLRAWIRFNKSMLLPVDAAGSDDVTAKRNASNGTIISDRIEGNERVLEVEFANDPLPTAPAPLGFVDMVVLLGDDLTTAIRFDSVRWIDGEVASQTVDGAFELTGYCDVGGNRLIRIEGQFGIRAVAPNPINSSADILFETVENGPTRLEVFDMAGRLVATLIDVVDLPVQAHVVEFRTEGLSSGGYRVVLSTPTQRSVVGVVVRD